MECFQLGSVSHLGTTVFQIATLADSLDLALEIDAFSSDAHARLPRHWSQLFNAFDKCWGDTVLWMHPPPKLIGCAVEKILRDEARGVIITPTIPEAEWFTQL